MLLNWSIPCEEVFRLPMDFKSTFCDAILTSDASEQQNLSFFSISDVAIAVGTWVQEHLKTTDYF